MFGRLQLKLLLNLFWKATEKSINWVSAVSGVPEESIIGRK